MERLSSIDKKYIHYLVGIEKKNDRKQIIREFIVFILVFISLIGIAYGGYKNNIFILVVCIVALVILLYISNWRKKSLEKEKEKQLRYLERDYTLAKEMKHVRENVQGHTTYNPVWRYSFDV